MAKVAVVQMTSVIDVGVNLARLLDYFSSAQSLKADLIVLPENFASMNHHVQHAETYAEGLIQHTIASLAKQFQMWVIAGTIPLKTVDSSVRASCLVYDDVGMCVARYDKIHLFDVSLLSGEVYQESETFEAGSEVVVVETPIGRVGLSVCYDLRFPELYRQLLEKSAEIMVVPSAFTAVTGAAHWDSLCRARAIENLCYVVAANQSGVHENGRKTFGHSMVVDPWGTVLTDMKAGDGVIVAEIDLNVLREMRRALPCIQHRVL